MIIRLWKSFFKTKEQPVEKTEAPKLEAETTPVNTKPVDIPTLTEKVEPQKPSLQLKQKPGLKAAKSAKAADEAAKPKRTFKKRPPAKKKSV